MAILPNKTYQGDCTGKLNELEPGSVDLVFADPPFNIGYEYDVYNDRQSRDGYLQVSREWMTAVHRVLLGSDMRQASAIQKCGGQINAKRVEVVGSTGPR